MEAIWIWLFVIGGLYLFLSEFWQFASFKEFVSFIFVVEFIDIKVFSILLCYSFLVSGGSLGIIPLSFLILLICLSSSIWLKIYQFYWFSQKKCFCIHCFFSMAFVFYFIDCHFGLLLFFSSAYFGFNLLSFVKFLSLFFCNRQSLKHFIIFQLYFLKNVLIYFWS